jgi:hypothetical protein
VSVKTERMSEEGKMNMLTNPTIPQRGVSGHVTHHSTRGVGHWLQRLALLAAVVVGMYLIYSTIIAPWYITWGATPAEVTATLPGDELAPHATRISTRAITIRRSPEVIWPWIVQMGQNRAGLYSYEGLENLVGSQIYNAGYIAPDWQAVQAGDRVTLGPWASLPYYIVERMEPPVALVWRSREPATGEPGETWQFYLQAQGTDATRLIVRHRGGPDTSGAAAVASIVDPIGFVMERRTMLGIQERTEGATRSPLLDNLEVLGWAVAFFGTLSAGLMLLFQRDWRWPLASTIAGLAVFLILLFGRPPLLLGIVLNATLVVLLAHTWRRLASFAHLS